jgi:hypothetical protein
LYGISGAASVGPALDIGRDLAHVTVARSFAIASAADNGDTLLIMPGKQSQTIAPPGADRTAISPSGTSAALWYSATSHFQVITGLPGSPVLQDVDASFLSGLRSFAVADDGMLAGAWDSGVWAFSSDGAAPLQADAGIASLAFFPGTRDLVFAASTGIFTPRATLFDSSNRPLSPAGVAASQRYVVVVDPTGAIYSIDAKSGTVAILDCDCSPSGVFPLGESLFRLTNVADGSVRLFDAAKNALLAAPVLYSECGVCTHPCRPETSGGRTRSGRLDTNLGDQGRTSLKGSPCAATPLAASPPPLTIGGLPATASFGQQLSMTISITSGFSADVSGTAVLGFHSASGGDDQMIQFGTGGRSVSFTIPAGSTQASFSGKSSVAVLTGTVAGTITITANTTADVAPPPVTATITTAATPPVIDSVTLSQTTGGVTVVVTGYTPTREISSGAFSFTAGVGATLAQSTITVPLSSAFATWFGNSASSTFGSEFTLTMPFTVQGNASNIVRVAVDLTNSIGVSAVASSK